ncbi:hypothetical protein B0H34DRAFT_433362 [Crassisporium funariophilum]|nr:hypothetical protein B0H34DRAFT_433362 [Crassisporium funariophilum]
MLYPEAIFAVLFALIHTQTIAAFSQPKHSQACCTVANLLRRCRPCPLVAQSGASPLRGISTGMIRSHTASAELHEIPCLSAYSVSSLISNDQR